MNNLSGAARRVTRNLDQFSVICVFGSVVGCVVLPLMIQSMESFIITFVVLCLTAKPLRGRLFPSANQTQETERRRSRDRDDIKKSKKSSPKKKQVQVSVAGGGGGGGLEQLQMREEDLQRQEQQRLEDRERRLEEKREKKARKREERLQRREEEKKEKEREEQIRRERQEARIQRKKEDKERKQKTATFEIPTRENIQAIVNGIKPLKRERKHSTSSSASSISAHSTSCHAPPRFQQQKSKKNGSSKGQRHSAPFRAASDPEISMATRNSPTPIGKPRHNTLPSTNGSTHWYSMDTANRSFPSLPVAVTTAPSSLLPPSSLPSSSMAAAQQPSQLFPSQYPLSFNGGGAPLQPSLVSPITATTLPGGQQPSSSTSWSSSVLPPTTTTSAHARNHQQVCELPLHQHLPPQAAWLPPASSGRIQHVHGSEMTCSGNNGTGRYFSPAPGTMSIHQQSSQQQSRLVGPGNSSGLLSSGGTTTNLYNGSLFYGSSDNSGLGTMNNTSTGLVDSAGNNCYSLFSSNNGGSGAIGDAAPFSAVGGLLNLDTSTLANHVRHQVVSTGSPLSVGSDVSSLDGQSSITGGGADSISCGRVDQSDESRPVETIGSAGHGISVGKPSYDEWPNL